MRRVVVTGMGLVSPFGMGVEHSWKQLLTGRSAARRVTEFEVEDLPCKIAHIIPRGDGSDGTFSPEAFLEPKELRKIGDFILYGIAAADEALADSGWKPETEADRIATGVMIGSGIGGIEGIAENAIILKERGPRRISPFFIPGNIINLVSGQVSIRHKLKGPNHAVVTACSTGAHAIGDAARLIIFGDADVMVAGGAESPIGRLSLAGFAACRALSTDRNDTPETASRPYDRDRDGFVMGEGAGVVILEELEHAKARGAKIYAEVTGYGLSGDAYHITAPADDGDGAYRCMAMALKRAGPRRLRHRLHQRARHLDHGRHDRACGRRAPGRQCRVEDLDVVDQIVDRPSARRGRRRRGDLLDPGHSRQHRARHHQSRQSGARDGDRPRAAYATPAPDRRRAVQLVRLRRHQRLADLPALRWLRRRRAMPCGSTGDLPGDSSLRFLPYSAVESASGCRLGLRAQRGVRRRHEHHSAEHR